MELDKRKFYMCFFTVTGERKRGLITMFCIIFQKRYSLKEQEFRDGVRDNLINVTEKGPVMHLSENMSWSV